LKRTVADGAAPAPPQSSFMQEAFTMLERAKLQDPR
jgi:hypothetical protein